ncbi:MULTISPECIES: hypothetical protein [unclassified Paenibacillus]|uniref:VOC family protein n=1 Tax=unclassified Paenibacillus TaxID=185978 RepID=UPI000954F0D8|nr:MULTISPECIES: hypothetical protein [unclassified Paenibacillus]ASS68990.1 glyoxalase/bleomycin resistance/dioxygenase family protein [Paenibacillus sp. RUD330]SIR11707.1 Catechol-2,3-dioxygenase [Paenibacillus sp. RU4X]SIR25424.1 Catechol-2,3-dioxygenase [Paenibacillus sp. RU4T]
MITHYSNVQLHTVSLEGVRQFYGELLQLPVVHRSEGEISFRIAERSILSFVETFEPISPAHLAFAIPYSRFEEAVAWAESRHLTFLKWEDGRAIDDDETGKNVYFRDGDGHLLEIIAERDGDRSLAEPLPGEFPVLFIREVGFPVESVPEFRQKLVHLMGFELRGQPTDMFTFAVGGTAHAVVVSKKRRWIPIGMIALPPRVRVTLGFNSASDWSGITSRLYASGIAYKEDGNGGGTFMLEGYRFHLVYEGGS